jgi:hypothetical protein
MAIIRRGVAAGGGFGDAVRLAARTLRAAPAIAAREEQCAELQSRLEEAVLELGRLTFRQWKSAAGDQQPIALACQRIEQLNQQYLAVVAQLADLKAGAGYRPAPHALDADAEVPPGHQPWGALPSVPPDPAGWASCPELPPLAVFQRVLPEAPARICPECLAEVAESAAYCPLCGMRR